jgi:hypothetical protein
MSSSNLIRWGGLAAVLGGALIVITDLVLALTIGSADTYSGTTTEQIAAVSFLAGKVLILIGLIGLYLHQAEVAGRFGLVAFLVALVGTALMVSSDWSEVFIAPILMQAAPTLMDEPPSLLMVGFLLNYGLETLGWLLFGVATFRARVFPRAAAAMLTVGVLLPFVGPSWSFVVWNSAIIWLGLIVLREKRGLLSVERVGAKALPQA